MTHVIFILLGTIPLVILIDKLIMRASGSAMILTLSEVLNVTNKRSDQPIGNMELNIQRISTFCGEQRMVLNLKKTKEMIFDFRVRKTTIRSIKLYDSEVERVTSFKLLGAWLDDYLKWDSNTEYIVKKPRTRL